MTGAVSGAASGWQVRQTKGGEWARSAYGRSGGAFGMCGARDAAERQAQAAEHDLCRVRG